MIRSDWRRMLKEDEALLPQSPCATGQGDKVATGTRSRERQQGEIAKREEEQARSARGSP